MAVIDTTRPVFGSASVASRFRTLFDAPISAFLGWNDARVSRKALNALSDRELEDIGLSRADIDVAKF